MGALLRTALVVTLLRRLHAARERARLAGDAERAYWRGRALLAAVYAAPSPARRAFVRAQLVEPVLRARAASAAQGECPVGCDLCALGFRSAEEMLP